MMNRRKSVFFSPSRNRTKYPRNLNINLKSLSRKSLQRYASYYGIHIPPCSNDNQAAITVARHFQKGIICINEEEVIDSFVEKVQECKAVIKQLKEVKQTGKELAKKMKNEKKNSKTKSLERKNKKEDNAEEDDDEDSGVQLYYCICRSDGYTGGPMVGCDNPDCDVEWFHMTCVGLQRKPPGKWYCTDCAPDVDAGELRGTRSKTASSNGTYCDMITYSLNHLPKKQGTLEEICTGIEKEFYDNLNWRLESNIKRTPVWTSFVRNQLIENTKFTVNHIRREIYGFRN